MKQDKIRFYQTRVFRSALAILLAVILLTNDTVENMAALFAGEQEPVQQAEVVVPDVQEAPQAANAPIAPPPGEGADAPAGEGAELAEPAEPAEPAGEAGDAGEAPASDSPSEDIGETPVPQTQAEGTEEAATPAPQLEGIEETPAPALQPEGDPLAQAIAQAGASYAYVSGELYSGQKLKEKDLLGSLSGLVVVSACIEGDDEQEQPSAILVHYYNTKEREVRSGYMDRGSASELNYEETVEGFEEEDVLGYYQSGQWPLGGTELLPVEKEDKPTKKPAEPTEAPEATEAPGIMPLGLGGEGEFTPFGDPPEEGYVTASFYNWDNDMEPMYETSVEVGGFALYAGETPTRGGHAFVSWYPDPTVTPLTEDTRFVAQFRPSPDRIYQVVIYYHFENGSEAAQPFVGTFAQGESYSAISPTVQGFDPSIPLVSDTITEATELSTVIKVLYKPSTGTNYTVHHYQRKLGATITENDRYVTTKYDLADIEELQATTGAEVTVKLKTYTGFSPLEDQPLSHRIAADGSTIINVFYTRNIYAIYFNAAGGTYVEPIVKEYGATITPAEKATKTSTRTGYNYNGWDQAIPDTMPLNGKTLTAQWTPLTANYALVYWLENVAGNGYIYDRTVQRSGPVGNTITLAESDKITIPYFTYNSYQIGMTIAGDGSTVVSVYYSRNSYTVDFAWKSSSSTATPAVGTQIVVGGQVVATYENANSPTYSFTAKYQEDISAIWPSGGDVVTPAEGALFVGWNVTVSGTTTSYVSRRTIMVAELCGTTDNTLTASGSWSATAQTDYLHYMFQCTDPNDPAGVNYTHAGVTRRYKEDAAYSQAATSTTGNWNAKAIEGLTAVVVVTNAGSGGYRNNVYLYYYRNTYKLEFFNFNATDRTHDILYEAPFADKEYTPNRPAGMDPTWTFQGWYTTKDCFPDSKFVWSSAATMPYHNLTLYALWSPPTYEVKYFATNSSGAEVQYATQTVTSGGYASAPAVDPERTGYTFVDWSLRGTGVPFQFDTQQIVRPTELVARWAAREDLPYTVNYWQVGPNWQPGDATGSTRVSGITPNPKTVPSNRTASTAFEEAPVVAGFVPDLVSKSLVISGDAGKDVIDFCYKAYTVLEYRVNYVDTSSNALMPQKVVTDETKSAIIEYAPTIPGYTPSTLYQNMRLGSDSSANVITFVYSPNATASYKVEYYYMDPATGTYKIDGSKTENLSGPIGMKVTAAEKPEAGYALDAANSTSTGYIQGDGSLVLRMYYTRTAIGWTVYHYRKGTTTALVAADTGTRLLGLTLTGVEKNIPGYSFDSANPASKQITIQADPAKNVIYMYYRPANVLVVTKTAEETSAKVGDTIHYTVTVKNTSTENLTGVVVTDPLMGPNWNIGALAAGQTSAPRTYTHTVTGANAKAGAVHNTATATGKDPYQDTVTGSAECTVPVSALIVTKTADKTQAAVGETINYTVKVKNVGSKTLTNVVAQDPYMNEDWTIGTLAPDAESTKHYSYTVTEADAGRAYVVNAVVVTGKDTDDKPEEGYDQYYVQIKATVNVKAKKKVLGTGAPAGEIFTFTLTGAPGAPMPAGASGQVMTVTGPEGDIDFGKIHFGAAGTYTYTVKETAGSKEGFTYSTAEYIVTVIVTSMPEPRLPMPLPDKLRATHTYTQNDAPVEEMIFTNTYLIPTQTVTVTKTWADSSNVGGVRPDKVELQLYREAGGGAPVAVGSVKEMTGTGNTWVATFPGVDKHDASGNTYTYSVVEVDPPKNYAVAYGGTGINLTVTNTIQYIPVPGKKIWDIQGTDFTKQSITVDLYRSDKPNVSIANQVVTDSALTGTGIVEWPFTFSGMLAYDKNGDPFTYTVKERNVPDGINESYAGTTITNTYPANRTLTIRVEWDYSAGAPAGERGKTASVNLLRNGTPYQNNILIPQTAGVGQTSISIPPLAYDSYTFTLVGAPVTNYAITNPVDPVDPDGTKVIRYTYVMPTKNITGDKDWNNLPSGFVKPSVTIRLWRKIATDTVATEVLPAFQIPSGSDKYTFANQPLYDTDGNEYIYSVSEDAVTGFSSAQNGLNFTNTYVPSDYAQVGFKATKDVTKDVGAPVARQFTFTLTRDSSAHPMPSEHTSGGNTMEISRPAGPVDFGTIEFEYPGVYKYTMREKQETVEGFTFDTRVYTIQITVTDPQNNGQLEYAASVVDSNGISCAIDEIVFDNLYVVPKHASIDGKLTWDDLNNTLLGRPASVQIQLYRKARDGGAEEAVGSVKTVNSPGSGNVWNYSFTEDLLKHDTQGRIYDYYVKQVTAVPNYAWAPDADPMDIIDTLSTIEVSGNKVWAISAGADFTKPGDVTIELYRSDDLTTAYRTQTVPAVTGSDTWPFTFGPLLARDPAGDPYTYTLEEINVLPGVDVDPDQPNYTVVNTVGDDAQIKVLVEWDHTGAPVGDRPTEVDVYLFRNDDAVTPKYTKNSLTGTGTSWPYTFLVPQGEYRGHTFKAKGEEFVGKYTKVDEVVENGVHVIRYAYIMPTVDVIGNKTWPGLPTGVPKPPVTLKLLRNSALTGDETTIPSSGSSYSFLGLDEYDPQGDPYDYTVIEVPLPGFDSVQNGYDFANTYNPEKATVTVTGLKKVGGDTGYPADSKFKFQLTGLNGAPMPGAGSAPTMMIEDTEGPLDFGTITYALPGVYEYTIEELTPDDVAFAKDSTVYNLKVTVSQVGGRLDASAAYSKAGVPVNQLPFEFTNIYTVPKQDQKAIKKWSDDGNVLNLRPASVELRLYRESDAVARAPVGSVVNVNGPMTGTADWEHIFPNMPIHDPSGNPYTYSVEEENVDANYEASFTGMTVTNTLLEEGVDITKTAVPAPLNTGVAANVKVGDTITYTISVRNTGARSVYKVRVLDQVPAGLTVTSVVTPATASRSGDNTVGTNLMWVLPEIQKGQTATITVQVTVDALPAGTTERDYVNHAYVRLPDGTEDPVDSDNPDDPDDSDTPYTPTPTPVMHQVVRLIKTATPAGFSAQDDTALVEGQAVTYTISMNNKRPVAGVTLSDQVPAGMTLVPGSITTVAGATNGAYNSATRTITWPSQGYPAGVTQVSFQATVDKFTPAEIAANTTAKTLSNTAGVEYARVAQFSATDVSNTVTHTATRRGFGVTKTAALVVGGTPQSYDAGLEAFPVETELGQEIQYKIDVSVKGYMPTTRGSIVIEDTLHKDVAFVAGSTVITPASLASKLTVTGPVDGKLTWTLSSLDAADQNFSITFRATAPTTSDNPDTPAYETVKVFSNAATVTDNALKNLVVGSTAASVYPQAEHTKRSGSTWHVVFEPALIAYKTSNPVSPLANGDIRVMQKDDLITYSITVENPGNSEAKKVRVMDILPEGVDFDSAVPVTGVTGPQVLTNTQGRTVLMWQINQLDRAVNNVVSANGRVTLQFTVKVQDPTAAQVISNTAYYRLPENETDPFPLVAGQPDPVADYLRTNQQVQHQVYTLAQTSTIAGGATAATAADVNPGDAITYTVTLNAAAGIKGVTVSDTLPLGLTPALGSIRIVHANGSVVNVPDSAYNSGTRTITWPSTNVAAGATGFSFTAIVEPLTGATLNRTYANQASVTLNNGAGAPLNDQTNTLYHKASVGYNTIAKQAELLVSGVGQGVDNGSAASPVLAERGQTVRYTLTVRRTAGTGNISGNVAVLDPLPKGMRVVPGSLQAAFGSGGSLVDSDITDIVDDDGVTYATAVFVLDGMVDGNVATLTFDARMPDFADDPDTPEIESERLQVNQAIVMDEDMQNLTYAGAVSGHAAGQPLYGEADFIRLSNETFHLIRGAALYAIKIADVPAGERVFAGEILTYTISITNSGAIDAVDVLVRDTLPDGLEYVAGSATCSAPGAVIGRIGNTVTWIIPTIVVGDTVLLTLQAQVLPLDGIGIRIFNNVAAVRETTPGGDPDEEIKEEGENPSISPPTDHFQLNGARIIVEKTDPYGEPLEGAEITLRQISVIDPHVAFETWSGVTNDEGEVVFDDVPIGEYVVYESEAPEGYILNPIRRSVNMHPTDSERSVVIVNYLLGENAVPNVGAGSRCVGDSPN